MEKQIEDDDIPAFATTIDSILDRYHVSAIERYTAVRALSAIVLALAPVELFVEDDDRQLNIYFGILLDRLHGDDTFSARSEIQDFIKCASRSERAALARFRWDQQ